MKAGEVIIATRAKTGTLRTEPGGGVLRAALVASETIPGQSPEDGGGMSAQAICFRDGHFSPADLCLLSDARGRQNKVR